MLSEKQIKLIKRSWNLLRNVEPLVIGDVFYGKLFIDIPQVKHLFKTPRDVQSKKLVDMLTLIVARLERLDELDDTIKQLAVRHVGYGVRRKHYEYVGNALIYTLQNALRTEWNDELEEAWVACYEILSDSMIKSSGVK